MSELHQLTPQPLWDLFAQICAIPHPSYHEEELVQFITTWARNNNLFVERDPVGNLLLRKPATPGMEQRQSVV
ncbi:MAG: cytosol nonspecific dipeptidase, partial [Enterobacteriaceae bacterium]